MRKERKPTKYSGARTKEKEVVPLNFSLLIFQRKRISSTTLRIW